MREYWAERLLARIMTWSPERIAQERPVIQAMAEYKYDEYQQFSPGMHFVESLALWLREFRTQKERETAYAFVKSCLVFISSAEMQHLASVAYPDYVRPRLLRIVAEEIHENPYLVGRVVDHPLFRYRLRQCLFLGLSDGAHIGVFRRVNRKELTHEQILQSHEITKSRAKSLLNELQTSLEALKTEQVRDEPPSFRTVIFLDDFAGSGRTCLRKVGDQWTGKIAKFFSDAFASSSDDHGLTSLIDRKNLRIILLLYVASQGAIAYLRENLRALSAEKMKRPEGTVFSDVHAVHVLSNAIRLDPLDSKDDMVTLQQRYFDDQITDRYILEGGTDGKFGFADGALPLVLFHNAPNNSISLLWAYDHCRPRGLFPRVSRHLET